MDDVADVLAAATARAAALASGEQDLLRDFLHREYSWTAHTGARFDRDEYLRSNQGGRITWIEQRLHDPRVVVVGDCAVLTCTVEDLVDKGSGSPETFVMPMTQTWVRESGRWVCLAGHAGPRLTNDDTAQSNPDVGR